MEATNLVGTEVKDIYGETVVVRIVASECDIVVEHRDGRWTRNHPGKLFLGGKRLNDVVAL